MYSNNMLVKQKPAQHKALEGVIMNDLMKTGDCLNTNVIPFELYILHVMCNITCGFEYDNPCKNL